MQGKHIGQKYVNLFLALAICLVIPNSLYAFKAGAHAVMAIETARSLPPPKRYTGCDAAISRDCGLGGHRP